MKKAFLLFASLLLLGGCGDDNGNGNGEFECTEQNTLCARLTVPADFTGETSSLMGLLYTSVPPAGAPTAIIGQVGEPRIGVNRPYDFEITGITATGDYYFVADLLMVGGGLTTPVAGVDYVYWTDATINFDGNPLTLGETELWLYE